MVSLSISENYMILEVLEAEIGQLIQHTGQYLIAQACQAMEAELLEREKARLRRTKQRRLHLLMRFKWMRCIHWQM